jgi:hypothetical protein
VREPPNPNPNPNPNLCRYLVLLRYLHRQYDAVAELAETCSCDTVLEADTNLILQQLNRAFDPHPDSLAVQLRLTARGAPRTNPYPYPNPTLTLALIVTVTLTLTLTLTSSSSSSRRP